METCRRWLSHDLIFSMVIAVLMVFAYLPFLGQYYPDGDELEIIMRGKHLAWGYVNEPLVPYASRFWGILFGFHMEAQRLIPLFCCSLAVFLVGLLTKLMGGKAPAQALASLTLAIAPIFIIASVRLDVLGFDFLFWTAIFCLMAHMFNTKSLRLWIWIGIIAGLALINKLSAALLMEAVLVGLCLTKWQRQLRTVWPYLGAVIAMVFVVPLVLWWSQHDWCGLEFLGSLYNGEKYHMSFAGYIFGQILYMNVLSAPVWLAGLIALLCWKPLANYRIFAIVWLVLLGTFLMNNSGIHYLSAAYAPLLAAGAIYLNFAVKRYRLKSLKITYNVALALCVAVFPLIIVRGIIFGTGNWHQEFSSRAMTMARSDNVFGQALRLLVSVDDVTAIFKGCPDNIVYNYSFEEQIKIAAKTYYRLPYKMRAKTLIYSDMEASAGALDYYGPEYGLPGYACCRFTNYYWGFPEDIRYVNVLAVSANYDDILRDNFVYCGCFGDNVRLWECGRIDMRDEWKALRRSFRED